MSHFPDYIPTNTERTVGKNSQSIAPPSQPLHKPVSNSPFKVINAQSYYESMTNGDKYSKSAHKEKVVASKGNSIVEQAKRASPVNSYAKSRKASLHQNESGRGRERLKSDGTDSQGQSESGSKECNRNGNHDGKLKNDPRITSGRYEQFMQNWQTKKHQIVKDLRDQTELHLFDSMGYGESPFGQNKNLHVMNVSVEDILKSKGGIYNAPAPKTFSFETLGQMDRLQQSHLNLSFNHAPPPRCRSSSSKRTELEDSFVYNINDDRSHSSEAHSLSPKFSRSNTFTKVLQGEGDNIESVFQNKGYVPGELEVELLKAKKDIIVMDEKLKTKDDEIHELRNCLEEAHSQLIKIHEIRDNDLKKMKQLEDSFIQQKKSSQTIEQDLQQSLNIRSFQTPQEETMDNTLAPESYQIVRLLKQDRALLRKRLEECNKEIDVQKNRNESLRKELNELLLNKHNRASQRGQNLNEVEHILTSYAREIENFRLMNQEADRKIQKLLDEIEDRDSQFEREFEEERKKCLQLKSEAEFAISEKERLESEIAKIHEEQKVKSQALKEHADKINEAINELAKENTHYRKQVKILSKDRGVKERIEYLDTYYKQQLRSIAKEKEVLRERLRNSDMSDKNRETASDDKDRRRNSSKRGEDSERSHEGNSSPKKHNQAVGRISKENLSPLSHMSQDDSFEEDKTNSRDKKLAELNEEITQLKKKLEEAQNKITKLNQEKEKRTEDKKNINETVENLESQIETLQGEIESLKAKGQKTSLAYEEKLRAANSQIDHLKNENTLLQKDSSSGVVEMKRQNEKLQEEIKSIQKTSKQKLIEVTDEISIYRKNNEELTTMIRLKEESIKQKEETIRQKEELVRQKEELIKQREMLIKELEDQIAQQNHKNDDEENPMEELERFRALVEKQKIMLLRQKDEINELKGAIDEQEKDLKDLEIQKGNIQEKLVEKDEIIDATNKQLASLFEQFAEANSKEQELLKQVKNLKKNQK